MNQPENPDRSPRAPKASQAGGAAARQQPSRDQKALQKAEAKAEREAAQQRAIEAAPYVVATVQASGIHPATSRLMALDMVTYSPDFEPVEEYHQVFAPGTDPGPTHLHGLEPDDLAAGVPFPKCLRAINRLLDGRTLIVHNAPVAWGFLVNEARIAMRESTKHRGRHHRRGGRRRRAGRIPKPKTVVDTLASARRQDIDFTDTRLRAVAKSAGLPAPEAKASADRARRTEASVSRESTELTASLFLHLRRGPLASLSPRDQRADRFGLQRSNVRVDAAEEQLEAENPGPFQGALKPGMELVVSPEITADPDVVIAAGQRAGLRYSEKLSRETSLVVCNKSSDLRGKAMHAHRKGIPLISDAEFLALTDAHSQPSTPGTAD